MTRHRLACALAFALVATPAVHAAEPKEEAKTAKDARENGRDNAKDKKPDESRPHVTLSWSTASEVDNFGYFVMRGDDEKGPFKALNEKAIPGAGNSDVPRDYRYLDFEVTPGKTYWYFLESVSTAGVREKFSPVLKRQCCKQAGAPSAGEATPPEAKKPAAAGETKPH